jgi:hypothetical protein
MQKVPEQELDEEYIIQALTQITELNENTKEHKLSDMVSMSFYKA